MKKFYVLLLGLLFVPFVSSAQQYKLSNEVSKDYCSYSNKIENVISKESKTYWTKWMKMIMGKIWIYLKIWDSAYKKWNYSLAIKNYQIAIDKLRNIRWTKELIMRIEKMIKEIEKLNNKSVKIDWNHKIIRM